MTTVKPAGQLLITVCLKNIGKREGMVFSGHKDRFEPTFNIHGANSLGWQYSLNVNDYWHAHSIKALKLAKYLAYRLALLKQHPMYETERFLIDQLNTLRLK